MALLDRGNLVTILSVRGGDAQFQLCVLNNICRGKSVKIISEVEFFRLILPHGNVSKALICFVLVFLYAKSLRVDSPHPKELKVGKC